MAKKKRTVAKKRSVTRKAAATTRRATRKVSKKLFKPKKGKNLIKGLVSVAINAGIQKGMNSVFEGRVKEKDFQKKNSEGNMYLDVKAYNEAVEKQKTIHGAANIGIWLAGAANALPKDYVSAEYLEINALEHGINTFVGKSKNEKAKSVASYIQGADDVLIEDADQEAYAMLEAADLIESAELEEAYIEDYENEDVAFLEESSNDDVEIEYEIEGIENFEGMNQVIPGIEEEN